jgi:hypothetical protein
MRRTDDGSGFDRRNAVSMLGSVVAVGFPLSRRLGELADVVLERVVFDVLPLDRLDERGAARR